jgi:hypothetical protein
MKKNIQIFLHPSGKIAWVKDGFCWPAFFLTPIWAFVKRLWLCLGVLLLINGLLYLLGAYADQVRSERLQALGETLSLGTMLVSGWYGNRWQRHALIRRGYRLIE